MDDQASVENSIPLASLTHFDKNLDPMVTRQLDQDSANFGYFAPALGTTGDSDDIAQVLGRRHLLHVTFVHF